MGIKGGKKRDSCNSIINKIYLKKLKSTHKTQCNLQKGHSYITNMYCQNHLDYNTFGNVLLIYDHLLCALIMSCASDTVWVCVPSCLC